MKTWDGKRAATYFGLGFSLLRTVEMKKTMEKCENFQFVPNNSYALHSL